MSVLLAFIGPIYVGITQKNGTEWRNGTLLAIYGSICRKLQIYSSTLFHTMVYSKKNVYPAVYGFIFTMGSYGRCIPLYAYAIAYVTEIYVGSYFWHIRPTETIIVL